MNRNGIHLHPVLNCHYDEMQDGLLQNSQDKSLMIHYSCDRCKRSIQPDEELRYTVHVEIQVTIDSSEFEHEESREHHLDELNEILSRLDDDERAEISEHAYQRRRFDLCSKCHREYVKNPLAVDAKAHLGFSEN